MNLKNITEQDSNHPKIIIALLSVIFALIVALIGAPKYFKNIIAEKDLHFANLEQENKVISASRNELFHALEKYDSFGDADPRHVSASFARSVDLRESEINVLLRYSISWALDKPLDHNDPFSINKGVEPEVTQVKDITRSKSGVYLGTRSDAMFFMFILLREEFNSIYDFHTPAQVKIHPMNCFFSDWGEMCSYHETSKQASLDLSIISSQGKFIGSAGDIIHAWAKPDFTLFVVGFDVPSAQSIPTLLYLEDESVFLKIVDRKNLNCPLSSSNGSVYMHPLNLERNYNRSGQKMQWQGHEGDTQLAFCPIDASSEPVVLSYIFQLTSDTSLWVPAYELKTQLIAMQDDFNLNTWIKNKIKIDQQSPIHLPIPIPEDAEAKRLRLRECFRNLMAEAPQVQYAH